LKYNSFYEKGLSVTPETLHPDMFEDWGLPWRNIWNDMEKIREELGLEGTYRRMPQDSIAEIRKIADITKDKRFKKSNSERIGKKEIPKDKFYLFKSCIMDSHYPGATQSIRYVFDKIGIDYLDDDRQSCCTGFAYYADMMPFTTTVTINARNFALAEEAGYPNIAPVCVTSYGVLMEAKEMLNSLRNEANEVLKEVNRKFSGDIDVYHVSEIFYTLRDEIKKEIKFSFDGLMVATHQGCHYMKMWREYAIPNLLDELIRITGAQPVQYEEKSLCCGMGFRHTLERRDLTRKIAKRKLRSISDVGAELVVSACPGCQVTFDRNQPYIEEEDGKKLDLVHMNYAQFIALAMGADPYKIVGIRTHTAKLEPLLERFGIL
jgi:heterodisulfide reductase subunit B